MYIFHLQIAVSSYISNLMLGPKVKGKKIIASRKGEKIVFCYRTYSKIRTN